MVVEVEGDFSFYELVLFAAAVLSARTWRTFISSERTLVMSGFSYFKVSNWILGKF